MQIRNLKIDSCANGRTLVEVWANLYTQQDVDDLIEWLRLSKVVMARWERINAKASRTAKAAAGKNEAAKPREVQSEPQVA